MVVFYLQGVDPSGKDVFVPFSSMLPMADPNDFVIGGWDISSMNLGDAMERAGVLDYDLQRQVKDMMIAMKPLPSIYYPDFIAANQGERADNILKGTKLQNLDQIRQDIRYVSIDLVNSNPKTIWIRLLWFGQQTPNDMLILLKV